MVETDKTFDSLPVSGGVSTTSPERAFLFSKWEKCSDKERWAHVAKRALERANLTLLPEAVASIEAEIKTVRENAALGRPNSPLCYRHRKNRLLRRDVYRVRLRGKMHNFVWSRRCNGLISYGGKLPPVIVTWLKIKQTAIQAVSPTVNADALEVGPS